jgi:nitroimidazol reductase NimA-like FMN-containing flavoprotein (pyridoxamine 5'-phosphate oxidase superfamily)
MEFEKTALNGVKRGAKKASYDKQIIYSILDAVEICHIAFNYEGRPYVQPINFGRNGDALYIHGSNENRMTNALIDAEEVCLNVTILDAMKLTRSAFHHSVNYRSVMVFGKAKELTANSEKLVGLKSIINHFVPNRWEHCRAPNENELKATRVLEIQIESASAKIADAPPNDNKTDLELDYWAGTIPVKTICEPPFPDINMHEVAEIPEHVMSFYNQRAK